MSDKITKVRKKIESLDEIEDVVMHDWGEGWISCTVCFDDEKGA